MVRFSAGQEHARRLLEAAQRYTCLAGGTPSGKTFLIVHAIITRALAAPESRHAILRIHADAARTSIALDTLPNVMRLCFPRTKLKEHGQDGFFELPNGARIWIGGLDDKERVKKILGLEYVSIFLNEASQIPYASALIAFTRLAQSVPGLAQRTNVDLNPTSKAHWTNLLFGEKRDPVSMQPLADPENYARAFLNPPDNAVNLSAEFLDSLANLPERQRKRFFEGVYVDELDNALWTYELIEANRCEPSDIAEEKRASVVVALDPSGAAGREDLAADEILVAKANNNTVTLPCWTALQTFVNGVEALPPVDKLPKLHLAVDVEILTDLMIALQPNAPTVAQCQALANFQKMSAVNMVTGIVTGALSLGKLAPILPIP